MIDDLPDSMPSDQNVEWCPVVVLHVPRMVNVCGRTLAACRVAIPILLELFVSCLFCFTDLCLWGLRRSVSRASVCQLLALICFLPCKTYFLFCGDILDVSPYLPLVNHIRF